MHSVSGDVKPTHMTQERPNWADHVMIVRDHATSDK